MNTSIGIGSCDTKKPIEKIKIPHDLGASGFFVVTPCFNKPIQSGLVQYYGKVADSKRKSIILNLVPSRTGEEIPLIPSPNRVKSSPVSLQ
jgi:4-hydroxy-tetrahydrodipicolinate synthase